MRKSIKSQNSKGFTIVELTVVLTVIALIAGSALAVGASRMEQAKIQTTQERMDFLINVLELFVKQYCYLPCPADASVANTNPQFGMEVVVADPGPPPVIAEGSGTIGGSCTRANYTHALPGVFDVVSGLVPVRTLQISPALALDGWGRRFDYIVNEELTYYDNILGNGRSFDDAKGNITILNTTTGGVTITSEAALVVLSHGANGHGAWKPKGVDRLDKDSTDADEQENSSDNDGVAGDGPFDRVFVQKFLTKNFDDIVQYRTKWQLPVSSNCNVNP